VNSELNQYCYQEWASLPTENYCVITPYLVPKSLPKKVNVGDGFILDSTVRLIGSKPKYLFSSRSVLGQADIDLINDTKLLVVAGANTLKDHFEITPGFSSETLKKIFTPIALCGLGHYGTREQTKYGFSDASIEIVRHILERFPLISVRCEASKEYLTNSIKNISEQVLMTSCPVIFSQHFSDLDFPKKQLYEKLVVTITDRAYIHEQLPLLKMASYLFKTQKKVLALHQNYGNSNLETYAEQLGYCVFKSENYADFLDLYRRTDIHFGNRVHAHLRCLSQGTRSFLTPFDLRQQFFSDSLAFPLIDEKSISFIDTYDFSFFLKKKKLAQVEMYNFISTIKKYISK
jgi:hypothetical protein